MGKALVDRPMVEWEEAVAHLNTAEQMRLCDEAAAAATRHARLSAYISRRLSGGRHVDAVKAQNVCARKVRQALGFTFAADSVSF